VVPGLRRTSSAATSMRANISVVLLTWQYYLSFCMKRLFQIKASKGSIIFCRRSTLYNYPCACAMALHKLGYESPASKGIESLVKQIYLTKLKKNLKTGLDIRSVKRLIQGKSPFGKETNMIPIKLNWLTQYSLCWIWSIRVSTSLFFHQFQNIGN